MSKRVQNAVQFDFICAQTRDQNPYSAIIKLNIHNSHVKNPHHSNPDPIETNNLSQRKMKLPPKEVTPKKKSIERSTKPARVSLDNNEKQHQAAKREWTREAKNVASPKSNSSILRMPARVSLDNDPNQRQQLQDETWNSNGERTSTGSPKAMSENERKPSRVSFDNDLSQRGERTELKSDQLNDSEKNNRRNTFRSENGCKQQSIAGIRNPTPTKPKLEHRLKNCYFMNKMVRDVKMEMIRLQKVYMNVRDAAEARKPNESIIPEAKQLDDEFLFLCDMEIECDVARKLYGALRFQCHKDGPKSSDPSAFEDQIQKMYEMGLLAYNFNDEDLWVGQYDDPGYRLHLLPGNSKTLDTSDKSLPCPIVKKKNKILV